MDETSIARNKGVFHHKSMKNLCYIKCIPFSSDPLTKKKHTVGNNFFQLYHSMPKNYLCYSMVLNDVSINRELNMVLLFVELLNLINWSLILWY